MKNLAVLLAVFKNPKTLRERFAVVCTMLFVGVQAQLAKADYDIGAPKSGGWAKVGEFFQELVNLLDGPGVLIVTFFSIFAVVTLWMFAPKAQGVISWGLRVLAGAIVILNIGTWITYLRG